MVFMFRELFVRFLLELLMLFCFCFYFSFSSLSQGSIGNNLSTLSGRDKACLHIYPLQTPFCGTILGGYCCCWNLIDLFESSCLSQAFESGSRSRWGKRKTALTIRESAGGN